MKNIPFLILILISILSCNFNVKVDLPKRETTKLKPFPKVEPSTFENIFVVDENKCKKWDLPITRFKIEFPNNVKVDSAKIGMENYDYISFQIIENDIVIEEFSIGYSDCNRLFEKELGEKSAEQTLTNLKQRFPNAKELYKGMAVFHGQTNYQLNAEIEIKEKTPQNFIGIYQIFRTHFYPKTTDFNPVNLSWTANQNSEIKNKADFGTKSFSGEIWKTFEFIE